MPIFSKDSILIKMKVTKIALVFIMSLASLGCKEDEKEIVTTDSFDAEVFWGENPWPEIRKKRINQLLPQALEAAEVDCWIVICRENNNDPIADHIGGENAGGTAAFLFYNDDEGFHSLVFSPQERVRL
jgi:Xaa-Pro dipeptidase